MGFPEKLYILRTRNNLSQKELAEKIGVAQASVNYWEKGQRTPSIEAAVKLADFFDITVESLLREDNMIKKQNPLDMATGTYYNKEDQVGDIHFTTEDYSLEELDQIWDFANFIKTQRKKDSHS